MNTDNTEAREARAQDAFWTDPWHTLTVTVKHHHDTPDCTGHPEPDECTEPRTTTRLTHPDDCHSLRSDAFPYRCATEQTVEDGNVDLPTDPGTHRVRSHGTGRDADGEYDQDFDSEPLHFDEAAWKAQSYDALVRAVGPYRAQSMDWDQIERKASGLLIAEDDLIGALNALADSAKDYAAEVKNQAEQQDERRPFRRLTLSGEHEDVVIASARLADLRNGIRPAR